MTKINIRKAKLDDIKDIVKMTNLAHREKAWPYIGLYKYDQKKLKNLKREIREKNSGANHFVARDEDNNLLGLFTYFYKKNTRLKHRVKFTWKIHPHHTKKGIGTKLLKYTLKDAKKRGFKKAIAEVVVENKASLKLALKYNFRIEGLVTKSFLSDDKKMKDAYLIGREL
jgi:L-amino acid N-acyltransferase YncA